MLNLTDMDRANSRAHREVRREALQSKTKHSRGSMASTRFHGMRCRISPRLFEYLAETARVRQLQLPRKQEGEGAWAKRFLWGKEGKPLCESVLLTYKYGLTGCVSSQAGCPVGCAFCASAVLGFERDLSAGEIIDEFPGHVPRTKENGSDTLCSWHG